jgi:beta-1,4-mannosyltransferase
VKPATAKRRYSPIRILSLPGTDFGGNPYLKHFCQSLEKAGMLVVNIHTIQAKYFKFDVLHLHWPEFYVTERPLHTAIVTAPTLLIYMVVTKLLRKKIVWTVHDVTPVRTRHPRLLRLYLLCIRILVDAYVFMTPSSEAEFKTIYPRSKAKPAWHVAHGPYPVSATPAQCQAELRERLSGGADCLLIGFLGDIRPNKNAEALVYLPRQDSIGREVRIVVAGVPDPTYDANKIEAPLARIPPDQLVRIRERLTDQSLADMIRAVDVVLLPYARGSNSGFGMLVLSCGQRLLCSALPMFEDLKNRLGPPWVYVFDHQAKNLSAELEAALSRLQHDLVDTHARSRLRAFLDDCSFDHGAQRLRELYERIIN